MNSEIEEMKKALELSPENTVLQMMFAGLLVKNAMYDEAEVAYRAVLSYDPAHARAKSGLASLLVLMGRQSEAAYIFDEYLSQGAADPAACIEYARILFAQGERTKALKFYSQAVFLDRAFADTDFERRLGISPGKAEGGELFQNRAADIEEKNEEHVEIVRPDISFADVGGMEKLKEDIRMKVIYPLANPDLFKSYGKKIGGGILLYGPPGCGKTYLARATAGEVKSGFISIGLHDILDMWIGESEKKLHSVFDTARQNHPSVLFFDEIDALAARRSDMKKSAGRQIINQFLSELDGTAGDNNGVLILGATNAPWHIDEAFKRPGRFDKIIFVPPPDEAARADILALQLKGKPGRDIDCDAVAKKTDGFSGADLRLVVDTACEDKLAEAMKAGKVVPFTTKDLIKAASGIKPSTREWFASAKNYAVYANESGIYDDIKSYMGIK